MCASDSRATKQPIVERTELDTTDGLSLLTGNDIHFYFKIQLIKEAKNKYQRNCPIRRLTVLNRWIR